MVDIIRHIILLLTLSALVASCGSQEHEPADSTPSRVMEFDVAPLSRANSTTSQSLYQKPFTVFSDWKRDVVIHDGFFNERVVYKESAGGWTHTNTQYWWPDFEHSFVAVHPFDEDGTLYHNQQYSNHILSFDVRMPDDYAQATDILVATHRRNFIDGNSDPVCFEFNHILSNFNIQVAYTNPTPGAVPLTVNSIVFKDIPLESTYSIAPARLTGNSTMTADFAFDPDTFEGWTIKRTGDFTVNFPKTGSDVRNIPPDNKPHQLFSAADALMLLPNPAAAKEMIVNYTTYDSAGSHDIADKFNIPQGWHPGYNYTLSLTITSSKVLFSIEVTEWKTGKTTNTTVPRT